MLKHGMMLLAPEAVAETGIADRNLAGRHMEATLYKYLLKRQDSDQLFERLRLAQDFLEDLHHVLLMANIAEYLSWEELSDTVNAILAAKPPKIGFMSSVGAEYRKKPDWTSLRTASGTTRSGFYRGHDSSRSRIPSQFFLV